MREQGDCVAPFRRQTATPRGPAHRRPVMEARLCTRPAILPPSIDQCLRAGCEHPKRGARTAEQGFQRVRPQKTKPPPCAVQTVGSADPYPKGGIPGPGLCEPIVIASDHPDIHAAGEAQGSLRVACRVHNKQSGIEHRRGLVVTRRPRRRNPSPVPNREQVGFGRD